MIFADVKYWIKCIDEYELVERINNRPILIWGAYSRAAKLCEEFERRNIKVRGYIDGHKDISVYKNKSVYRPDTALSGKECFIIVAIDGIRTEIKNHLNNYNYVKGKDYFYFSEYSPDIKISGFKGEYHDIYNNTFIYQGEGSINVAIQCIGGDNTVIIGKNYEADENLLIRLSFGGIVELGEGFISKDKCLIDASWGGEIRIGKNVNMMGEANINAKQYAKIKMGDYVSIGERFFLSGGEKSNVSIGNDCMFSSDVTILGTNGHSIIDLNNKKNRTLETEKPILIENHVWLGKGSTILYGTTIGHDSIVGTQSVAKGNFPSNSVIVGNMARVVKNNYTWDRRRGVEFEEL